MKELDKKELESYIKNGFLTVGDLKEFIKENNLPDTAPVMIQRVEDVYYEKHNWQLYLKNNENTQTMTEHNKKVLSGEYLNKYDYPLMNEVFLKLYTEENFKNAKSQYTPAWSGVYYSDDKDMLFIDLHY